MIKQRQFNRIPLIRLSISAGAILLTAFCVAVIAFGSNSSSNDISLGILAGITAIFALGQWFFPFPSDKSEQSGLPYVHQLVRGSFRMGDDAAANFPYITEPLQDLYNTALEELRNASVGNSAKHGILILGEANSGKTRFAFEVLTQTLPNWPVLRWTPDRTLETALKEVSQSKKQLAFVIEDLQDYIPSQTKDRDGNVITVDPKITTLRSLLETLYQSVEHLVILATCRSEDEVEVRAVLGQLFTELTVISISHFKTDIHDPEVIHILEAFQKQGSPHAEDWDGTLGSLVLGLSRKNHEYLKLRNIPAGLVLRAMKLLTRAGILTHTEQRLRHIGAEVFGEEAFLTGKRVWQEAVNQLVRRQFVTEEYDTGSREVRLAIRKDTYFDKVITDYPASTRQHQLYLDFLRLMQVLIGLKDTDALVDLGLALAGLGKHEEALDVYEQTVHLDPTHIVAYFAMGAALSSLKRYDDQLAVFEEVRRIEPAHQLTFFGVAGALANLDRNEEALEAYDQSIRLNPNFALTHAAKGRVHFRLRQFEEALSAIDEAIRLDPAQANYYYNKGEVLAILRRHKEALEAFDQAIRLDPKSVRAYNEKGRMLTYLKRHEEALVVYNQAIALDPADTPAYFGKWGLLFGFNRIEEALDAIKEAVRLASNGTDIYNEKRFTTYYERYQILGNTLAHLKRFDEAAVAFEQAIALDPKDLHAYLGKHFCFFSLKKYEEALATIEQAVHLAPNDADLHMKKAKTLVILERNSEALATYNYVLTLDPGNPGALLNRKAITVLLGGNEGNP